MFATNLFLAQVHNLAKDTHVHNCFTHLLFSLPVSFPLSLISRTFSKTYTLKNSVHQTCSTQCYRHEWCLKSCGLL